MMAKRGPSLLIFGSQTSLPTAEKLASLRTTLLQEPALHGLAATIAELQDTWHDLVSHDPDLKPIPGEKVLSSFATWINEGVFQLEGQPGSVATPNLVLTPLTVILHLVEYFRFLDKAEYTHEQYVESEDKSFEGFCTGLLAASALSLSRDTKQSVVMAAAALRLAVAIGAYVDLDEGVFASPAQEVTCVVVRCKEAAQREEVDRLLETIPEVCSILLSPPLLEDEESNSLITWFAGLYFCHHGHKYHHHHDSKAGGGVADSEALGARAVHTHDTSAREIPFTFGEALLREDLITSDLRPSLPLPYERYPCSRRNRSSNPD